MVRECLIVVLAIVVLAIIVLAAVALVIAGLRSLVNSVEIRRLVSHRLDGVEACGKPPKCCVKPGRFP
jgi:hypothetical protein